MATPHDDGGSGVVLRRESGLPLYLQLVDQLRYLVQAGRYREGSYLPTTRRLADELGVNFNTVNRAYRQLQRDGLIRSTPGKGAVVIRPGRSGEGERGPLGVASYRASDEEIDAILLAALERALAAGITVPDLATRVVTLVESLAKRVPAPARVAVDAGAPWRSAALAARLAELTNSSVESVYDPLPAESASAPAPPGDAVFDVIVRPTFGAWVPALRGEGIAPVDVPVSLSRDTARDLIAQGSETAAVVVASGEEFGSWLAESAGALLENPASVRFVDADDASACDLGDGACAFVEANLPGLAALRERYPSRVFEVTFSWPSRARATVLAALRAAREA